MVAGHRVQQSHAILAGYPNLSTREKIEVRGRFPKSAIGLVYNWRMIHEILPVGMLQCNCSILGDETSREAIVVDPGDDIPRILAILARHKLTVKQILITHAHID